MLRSHMRGYFIYGTVHYRVQSKGVEGWTGMMRNSNASAFLVRIHCRLSYCWEDGGLDKMYQLKLKITLWNNGLSKGRKFKENDNNVHDITSLHDMKGLFIAISVIYIK